MTSLVFCETRKVTCSCPCTLADGGCGCSLVRISQSLIDKPERAKLYVLVLRLSELPKMSSGAGRRQI